MNDDLIVCPFCEHAHPDTGDYPDSLKGDGDVAQWECDACDNTFTVALRVSYQYEVIL